MDGVLLLLLRLYLFVYAVAYMGGVHMRLIRGETTTASETGGLIWILFYGDFCTVASVFSE
jgi:hypothetical protein